MSRKQKIRQIMLQIQDAHRDHMQVWNKVRSEYLVSKGFQDWREAPHEIVWEANGPAYETARPHWNRMAASMESLFGLLPFDDFYDGDSKSIDAILDFLEVDVLAFRCGYIKAGVYRQLKSVELNEKQSERLRNHCLQVCQMKNWLREFEELSRLMIKLANREFVRQIEVLQGQKYGGYTNRKALALRKKLGHHRPDLI